MGSLTFKAHLLPSTDLDYSLGSSDTTSPKRWKINGYEVIPLLRTTADFTAATPEPSVQHLDNTTHPVTNVKEYGTLLTLPWRKTGTVNYTSQLLISSPSGTGGPHAYIRRNTVNDGWSDWSTILDDKNTTIPSTVPTLSWGGTSTLLTVNGTNVQVKMPSNPNSNTQVRTYASSTNVELPLIGGNGSGSVTATAPALTSSYKGLYGAVPAADANKATINPSTGRITIPGGIKLTSTSYGTTLPASGTTGQIFFQTSSGDNVANKITTTAATANTAYFIIGAAQAGSQAPYIATANNSASSNKGGIWFNGSTGVLHGAAWNDYAECRSINDKMESGRVVIEQGDDTLRIATERMQPGAEIVSDTYGFIIGETEKAATPIAVTGRVLAYPYEDREEFKNNIGRPVCSGPNGTVSIMTDEEYRNFGYCAIGTISAIPNYEYWGPNNNIKVDGRIWIRIR